MHFNRKHIQANITDNVYILSNVMIISIKERFVPKYLVFFLEEVAKRSLGGKMLEIHQTR